LDGTHAAHTCLNEEEIPKVLFPKINKAGTINPINGPATYQGQGCLINSITVMLKYFIYVSKNAFFQRSIM
jgi:hypothetical protein